MFEQRNFPRRERGSNLGPLAPEASTGGILVFSYIRRLGSFFGVQNFEFQYFLGFQKNKYLLGYEDFVDIFWGSSQIGLYLRAISTFLWSFLKVITYRMGIFWGLLKFQIFFFWVLEIPDFLGG